jgi:hypothetical protein
MSNFKSIDIIEVASWGDLKSFIVPLVITSLIGLLLLFAGKIFFALVFLLTAPCMILITFLEIREAVKKDKERGHYCPDCNGLLRRREISGMSERHGLWDGWDFYCFKCQKSANIELIRQNEDKSINDLIEDAEP